MRKFWHRPLALAGLVVLSQAFRLPSPVRNVATGAWVEGYHLELPSLYILLAPFYGIADRLTLLSFHQGMVFLATLLVLLVVGLGLKRAGIGLLCLVAFLAWGALCPRPMARLVAPDADTLLIDFHSHSERSHDGRPDFSAAKNIAWHREQGYHASFVTDHNRIETSQKAKAITRTDWQQSGYRSLEGEEISLKKTHLVVLGNRQRIDNQTYDSDFARIPLFIKEMNRLNLPVIASLPEYWWYHWRDLRARLPITSDPDAGTIDDFVKWGINGFEIVNSAPKALDFPPAYRREIVELCRRNNLFMTGISDTHGYSGATAAWNAMRIPGWQKLDPDQLEAAVLKTLKTERFGAVEVLERVRYNPENVIQLAISPWVNALLYWRSLCLLEVISWAGWIGLITLIRKKVWLKR